MLKGWQAHSAIVNGCGHQRLVGTAGYWVNGLMEKSNAYRSV